MFTHNNIRFIRTRNLQDPAYSTVPQENVLIELIREIREQRRTLSLEHERAAAERKSERRWKMIFQGLFFGAPILIGVLYFLFFLNTAGFRWGPWGDVVGVVRIEGEIAPNKLASADNIIPALEKASLNPNVKAVVLSIDSPGGAPVESERIYNSLATLKKKHTKPVIAVINNLGASAAYMIALHADKIVAGKYSLAGSVGAIMDLQRTIPILGASLGWRLQLLFLPRQSQPDVVHRPITEVEIQFFCR